MRLWGALALAGALLAGPACATGPTLDGLTAGAAPGVTFSFPASTAAFTITTSNTNDIVVVIVAYETATVQGHQTVTGVADTSGLTWHKRIACQYSGGNFTYSTTGFQTVEEWWASSTGTLSSDTITATLSGSIDNGVLTAYAVHGAHSLSAPWDANGSLPTCTITNTSYAATTGRSLDLMLWATGDPNNGYQGGAGGVNFGGGLTFGGVWNYQFSQVNSAAVSGPTTYTNTIGAGSAGMIVNDAIAGTPLLGGPCTLATTGVSTGGC